MIGYQPGMRFLAFLVALTIVNAQGDQSQLPHDRDPQCQRMDATQWDAFDGKDIIRKLAFAGFGIPFDSAYSQVLFDGGSNNQLDNYFCADGLRTTFEPARVLKCNPTTVNLIDSSNSAPGSVTVNVASGITASITLTEMKRTEVAFGASVTISAGISAEGINGRVDRTFTFNTIHARESSRADAIQTNTAVTVIRTINIGPGNVDCTANMTTTTCQLDSKGKYPIYPTGWVGWYLKDRLTLNGHTAQRWYAYVDNFHRDDILVWATLDAQIASTTYSTVFSQCETPNKTARHFVGLAQAERDWRTRIRAQTPGNGTVPSPEEMLSQAKASVPDHLKDKVMRVGGAIVMPIGDHD